MPPSRQAPSYAGRHPASPHATAAARGASRKSDTKCEVLLRRALWRLGFRYRKNVIGLPGKPDLVLPGARVAVFCDGDFWHGRDWEVRKARLLRGANSSYWVSKIEGNIARDRAIDAQLEAAGWTVVRLWETDILANPEGVADAFRGRLSREPDPRQESGQPKG